MFATILPLALAATAQSADHSTLHPQEALVYFQMADVQRVLSGYQDTAYARVLEDKECRKSLEKALKLQEGELEKPGSYIHTTLDLLTNSLWSKVQPSLADIRAISASFSLEGTTPAEFVEAILGTRGSAEGGPAKNPFGTTRTLIVVDFGSPELAANLYGTVETYLHRELGASMQSSQMTLGDHEVSRLSIDAKEMDGIPSAVLLDGARIYGVIGAAPEEFVAKRLALEAANRSGASVTGSTERFPGGAVITSDQRFAEGRRAFRAPEGITVFEFQSRIGEAFYATCPKKEYIQPILDFVLMSLGPDLDMLVRGGQWRVQLRYAETGSIFVTEAFQKDLKLGEYDRVFSNHSIRAESLDYVHQDSVLASAMTVDTELFSKLLRTAFQEFGEDPFKEWEERYGFRPETDLLEHLGSSWVSSLPLSSIGLANLPGLSYWIDLKDKAGFLAGMEKLGNVIKGEVDAEYGMTSKAYHQQMLFTFRSKTSQGGVEAMLQPTVVVFDDRVLITLSSTQAKKEIKRAELPAIERTAHAIFNQRSKPQGMIVEFAYSDWAKVLGRLYSSARGFLPMIQSQIPAGAADEIPVDLNNLPEADLFTNFFRPTVRHRERVGDDLRIYCESSLGPELSGVVAGGIGMGAMFLGVSAVSSEELEPVEQAEEVEILEAPLEPVEPAEPK